MALFDSIISEAAQKFGLGSKAAPLLSETLKLMTDQQNGGLAGFIDRFRQAGLGDLASSWISTGANQPLSENQVQNVLGNNVISQLASKVGLSSSVAIPALAYMIPKVIDYLTPNGTVPTGIPSAVSSFLSGYDDLRRPVIEREERTGGSSFLRWLPLLLLIPLIILGYRYCNRTDTMQTAMTVATPTATVAPTPAAVAAPVHVELGEFIVKTLPNGVTIRIPSRGVESKLIAFIEDPTKKVDKETWFSFDRLEFETDSATLKPSSGEQLKNMAEILKAYPNVNVKIGGYTDNVGNDAYNMKLSTDRAVNTEKEIEALGVADIRLDAEGYGKQHPVADNSTEEGRQRNRRIDIRVTKK